MQLRNQKDICCHGWKIRHRNVDTEGTEGGNSAHLNTLLLQHAVSNLSATANHKLGHEVKIVNADQRVDDRFVRLT